MGLETEIRTDQACAIPREVSPREYAAVYEFNADAPKRIEAAKLKKAEAEAAKIKLVAAELDLTTAQKEYDLEVTKASPEMQFVLDYGKEDRRVRDFLRSSPTNVAKLFFRIESLTEEIQSLKGKIPLEWEQRDTRFVEAYSACRKPEDLDKISQAVLESGLKDDTQIDSLLVLTVRAVQPDDWCSIHKVADAAKLIDIDRKNRARIAEITRLLGRK